MSTGLLLSTPTRTRAVLVALCALVLAACSASDPRVTIVDGWSIGPEFQCEAEGTCEAFVVRATQSLARRDGGHPPIVRASVHQEGAYPCRAGGGISPIVRSGAAGVGPVVLFELADGSRSAVSVGFALGGDLVAHDRGPGVAPWKCHDGALSTEHPPEAVFRF